MNDKLSTSIKPDCQNGFTFIELSIAMVIGLIILGAVGNMYIRYTDATTVQNVSADLQLSGRAALEFMVREIRMAGFTQSESDADKFGIDEAQSTKIRFIRDVVDPANPNEGIGEVNEDGAEIISYYLDPGDNSLQRQLNEATPNMSRQPLVGGIDGQVEISNLDFTYFDENENILLNPDASLSLIRSIIVTLTAQAPAGKVGMVERTFVSRVRCRNLGI